MSFNCGLRIIQKWFRQRLALSIDEPKHSCIAIHQSVIYSKDWPLNSKIQCGHCCATRCPCTPNARPTSHTLLTKMQDVFFENVLAVNVFAYSFGDQTTLIIWSPWSRQISGQEYVEVTEELCIKYPNQCCHFVNTRAYFSHKKAQLKMGNFVTS